MKKILLVNFIDAFSVSAVGLILPLLLVSRSINLGFVGIILSAFPLVYTAMRSIMPIYADKGGYKKFYVINALGSIVSPLVYFIANSQILFLLGRLVDSTKSAAMWSVNRNSLIETSSEVAPYIKTAKMVSVRYAALALGALGGGMLVFAFGFEGSFLILSGVGVIALWQVAKFPKDARAGKVSVDDIKKGVNIFTKSGFFLQTSAVMIFESFVSTLIVGFVLPIYLKFNGLDYMTIGLVIGGYLACSAASVFFFTRIKVSARTMAVTAAALYVIPAILLVLLPFSYSLALLMVMALGDGIGSVFWEMIITKAVKGSSALATDIGAIHIPSNLGAFFILVVFGFVVQNYGFAPAFVAAAAFHLIFVTLSARLVGKDI